jgi:hypothetical protein
MVARIAPSPIDTSVAIGDALTHAPTSDARVSRQQQQQPRHQTFQPEPQKMAANVPPPPSLPGEAFAAAIIAGQLPPRPVTPEQLKQRLGSAWQPPASPLRLMDRSA